MATATADVMSIHGDMTTRITTWHRACAALLTVATCALNQPENTGQPTENNTPIRVRAHISTIPVHTSAVTEIDGYTFTEIEWPAWTGPTEEDREGYFSSLEETNVSGERRSPGNSEGDETSDASSAEMGYEDSTITDSSDLDMRLREAFGPTAIHASDFSDSDFIRSSSPDSTESDAIALANEISYEDDLVEHAEASQTSPDNHNEPNDDCENKAFVIKINSLSNEELCTQIEQHAPWKQPDSEFPVVVVDPVVPCSPCSDALCIICLDGFCQDGAREDSAVGPAAQPSAEPKEGDVHTQHPVLQKPIQVHVGYPDVLMHRYCFLRAYKGSDCCPHCRMCITPAVLSLVLGILQSDSSDAAGEVQQVIECCGGFTLAHYRALLLADKFRSTPVSIFARVSRFAPSHALQPLVLPALALEKRSVHGILEALAASANQASRSVCEDLLEHLFLPSMSLDQILEILELISSKNDRLDIAMKKKLANPFLANIRDKWLFTSLEVRMQLYYRLFSTERALIMIVSDYKFQHGFIPISLVEHAISNLEDDNLIAFRSIIDLINHTTSSNLADRIVTVTLLLSSTNNMPVEYVDAIINTLLNIPKTINIVSSLYLSICMIDLLVSVHRYVPGPISLELSKVASRAMRGHLHKVVAHEVERIDEQRLDILLSLIARHQLYSDEFAKKIIYHAIDSGLMPIEGLLTLYKSGITHGFIHRNNIKLCLTATADRYRDIGIVAAVRAISSSYKRKKYESVILNILDHCRQQKDEMGEMFYGAWRVLYLLAPIEYAACCTTEDYCSAMHWFAMHPDVLVASGHLGACCPFLMCALAQKDITAPCASETLQKMVAAALASGAADEYIKSGLYVSKLALFLRIHKDEFTESMLRNASASVQTALQQWLHRVNSVPPIAEGNDHGEGQQESATHL